MYGKWIAQLALQHGIVMHLIWQSLTGVAAVVLFGVLVWWGAMALLDRVAARRSAVDLRSLHTLRVIASLGIQLVTLLMVLLVVFGAPNQVPTILGLATAGLTVVFQDFILAFFGWFVLMGKNGIRVGDWWRSMALAVRWWRWCLPDISAGDGQLDGQGTSDGTGE